MDINIYICSMRRFSFCLFIGLVVNFTCKVALAQNKQPVKIIPARMNVVIEPVFNGKPLILDSTFYVNSNGDMLNISTLKFYITKFSIVPESKSGIIHRVSDSHLFDAGDSTTSSFSFDLPSDLKDNYDRICFTLGVDSIDNTNGANSGDLDPVKGMYWAWNTGYVMAKIEGTSKACHTLHNAFEFHIGGYMPPYNTSRKIELRLPEPLHPVSGLTKTIIIKADVAAWFAEKLDLSKTNSIVIPGKAASEMADRYARMFSLEDVKQ